MAHPKFLTLLEFVWYSVRATTLYMCSTLDKYFGKKFYLGQGDVMAVR